ncbi:MAG: hypothetical protein J0L75_02370 [Spirochaetes bacterium]|nr:hypothetical protein [Spirochaetota bacterium]
MKHLITLVVGVALLGLVTSCAKCTASSGCSAAGAAVADGINKTGDTILFTAKDLCGLAGVAQTLYGASCTIAWK